MKTKTNLHRIQHRKRKLESTQGNLTNQQPSIWNQDKKERISKGWPSKKKPKLKKRSKTLSQSELTLRTRFWNNQKIRKVKKNNKAQRELI
jgi:uncharacterized protein YaeQ